MCSYADLFEHIARFQILDFVGVCVHHAHKLMKFKLKLMRSKPILLISIDHDVQVSIYLLL